MTALLGKQKRRPFCHMAPLCRRLFQRTKPRCGGTRPSSAGYGVPPTGMAFLRRVLRSSAGYCVPPQFSCRRGRGLRASLTRKRVRHRLSHSAARAERESGAPAVAPIRQYGPSGNLPMRKIRQINRALMPPCSSGASTPQPHRDRRGRPAGGAPAEDPAASCLLHLRRGHRPRP